MKKNKPFIHKSAFVDKGAKIGAGTYIWHFSHIMKGAVVGELCRIGQNVFIAKGAVIADNVKIQNNVSVYAGVTLEDGVFIGPSAVFTNVKAPRSLYPVYPVRELSGSLFSNGVNNTIVKKGATIGANATIICPVVIGSYAFVGAGSVITKDVPDFGLVYGNPARLRGWICKCGQSISSAQDKKKIYKCPRCHFTPC